MPYGWEGNSRYGVVLAMNHRLQWFVSYGLTEISTPPTVLTEYGTLYL